MLARQNESENLFILKSNREGGECTCPRILLSELLVEERRIG